MKTALERLFAVVKAEDERTDALRTAAGRHTEEGYRLFWKGCGLAYALGAIGAELDMERHRAGKEAG